MQTAALGDVVRELIRRSHETEPADVVPVAASAAARVGLRDLEVWLVDPQQRVLTRLGAPTERVGIDSSVVGDTSRRERTNVIERGGATRIAVPLVDGVDRLGVACAAFDLDALDVEAADDALRAIASVVATMIVSKSSYTDVFEVTRRVAPMAVAAEMRWSLLPAAFVRSPRVVLAGTLEPAYDIAGDAFDYALNSTTACVGIFDALGHGLAASRLANLTVGTYRNGRRNGASLQDTAEALDDAITVEIGDSAFVTGVMAQLDLVTGELRWVNAGHPPPLLLRGTTVVDELARRPDVPLGIRGTRRTVHTCRLEPDDTVVLYTDGVIEARSRAGELFGIERFRDHLERAACSDHSDAEKLRRLVQDVLEHQGTLLHDDAAIVFVTWRASAERPA